MHTKSATLCLIFKFEDVNRSRRSWGIFDFLWILSVKSENVENFGFSVFNFHGIEKHLSKKGWDFEWVTLQLLYCAGWDHKGFGCSQWSMFVWLGADLRQAAFILKESSKNKWNPDFHSLKDLRLGSGLSLAGYSPFQSQVFWLSYTYDSVYK